MKSVKKLVPLVAMVFSITAISNASAESRLWCVSADGNFDWKMAKWNSAADFLKDDQAGYNWYDQVWLYGELEAWRFLYDDLEVYSWATFSNTGNRIGYLNFPYNVDLGYVIPSKINSAQEYCSRLVKICTDEFGANYRYIGASGGALVGSNGISLQENNATYYCPNWRIDKSTFIPQNDGTVRYQVSCMDTTWEKTIFWESNVQDVWTNGKYRYSVDPEVQYLDSDIGELYCAGNTGIKGLESEGNKPMRLPKRPR